MSVSVSVSSRRAELRELALLFVRLGLTALGGPAAHIAMMQAEVVERRRWLTSEEFLDLLGATNLIPGPNSTEMAIHVGHRRAGFAGLVVAGACFVVPSVAITLAIAWLYVHYGAVPRASGLLYGVKPVIIAVIVQAIAGLARSALATRVASGIAAAVLVGSFLGGNELALLFGAGLVALVARGRARPGGSEEGRSDGGRAGLAILASASGPMAAAGSVATAGAVIAPPAGIFLVFLKIGSILFGSGYVLLAFLRADLVERLHWLGEKELLDAVAVGQVTPGPVSSTATFLGYVIGGGLGAAAATLGIFLPAFVFVAASGWLIPRLRRSERARGFLDGVNAASLALMAHVTWDLGRSALVDLPAVGLAVASAILLLRFKVSSTWLVLAGAGFGIAVTLVASS